MLYVERQDINEKDFTDLLGRTRENALSFVTDGRAKPKSGIEFQDLVYDKMCDAAINTEFSGAIRQTGAHSFPDIVAKKYFGVEVKMASGEKWTSLGNSIMESTRAEDVERIYMFFGKFGRSVDMKFRPYQECLSDISVTHSPRYTIDMNLPDGFSIFDKIGIDYNTLRKKNNPISTIKDYYRRQLREGEELWWLEGSEKHTSPIIRPFRSLPKEEQDEFLIDTMILFPEIFGSNRMKFERPAAYLMTQYNAVCGNVRDIFTAGGQELITIKTRSVKVPKIHKKLFEYSRRISQRLETLEKEKLRYYWRTDAQESRGKPIDIWLRLLSERSVEAVGPTPLDVFEAGMYAQKNTKSSAQKSSEPSSQGSSFNFPKVLAHVKDWFQEHKA